MISLCRVQVYVASGVLRVAVHFTPRETPADGKLMVGNTSGIAPKEERAVAPVQPARPQLSAGVSLWTRSTLRCHSSSPQPPCERHEVPWGLKRESWGPFPRRNVRASGIYRLFQEVLRPL